MLNVLALVLFLTLPFVPVKNAGGHGALHGSGGAGGPAQSGEHRILQTDRHLLHGPGAVGDDVEV